MVTLSKAIEEMRNETAEKTKIENALNLLKLGKLSFDEIASAIGLSVKKIKELAKIQPARP